jgi:hypothetical protein
MGVNGVLIFQKRLYEGTLNCQKGLYVCISALLQQYEEKIRTTAWEMSANNS